MTAELEHDVALACDDLGAWYGEGRARVDAFEHLDLQLRRGEVLGVFGPNGCGKSTLTRALLGLHPDRAGAVTLAADGRIGWVPQAIRESFFAWASLRENLLLTRPAGDEPRSAQLARIDATAEELGVDVDLGLRPPELSDGLLQQVAIVRALAREPTLLVGDECFSALDVDAGRRLRRALRQRSKKRQMGALLVLHDLDALLEIADRVLVIERRPFTLRQESEDASPSARMMRNASVADVSRPAAAPREGGLLAIVGRLLEPSGE